MLDTLLQFKQKPARLVKTQVILEYKTENPVLLLCACRIRLYHKAIEEASDKKRASVWGVANQRAAHKLASH